MEKRRRVLRPMNATKPAAAKRHCRKLFFFLCLLSLAGLYGCGAGWQPEPRDHPIYTRPGVQGSDSPFSQESEPHL